MRLRNSRASLLPLHQFYRNGLLSRFTADTLSLSKRPQQRIQAPTLTSTCAAIAKFPAHSDVCAGRFRKDTLK